MGRFSATCTAANVASIADEAEERSFGPCVLGGFLGPC
jgi:hypothetical protein